jgi:undecaprenyl-phosphate 4-deoxy-4-formamido-L-arabinose transferase
MSADFRELAGQHRRNDLPGDQGVWESPHMTQPRDSDRDTVEFSALITCHYEENSIDEFYGRLRDTLESLNRPYEFIFVNDGSHDRTWEKVRQIFERDEKVHAALDMARNSGQQAAITAALCESRGRSIILMDSDLQLAPEELPSLVTEYDKGYDLVTGYRMNRKDSLFRIIPSKLANVIMRKASRSNIYDFGCTFKIYNGQVLRAFCFGPTHTFSNVEVISRIERICQLPVTHYPRKHGKSGWTFTKLMQYNMDNIAILSERPFQWVGFLCLAAVVVFILRLLMELFIPIQILPQVSNGLLLNAIVITLLVNVALLAMVGEFAIRAFLRVRQTPRYIIREALRRG